jgi:hypothetical protein
MDEYSKEVGSNKSLDSSMNGQTTANFKVLPDNKISEEKF